MWHAALVGPARYPEDYCDVVIFPEGRPLASTVRQGAPDGNVHGDPAAEIGRVLAAYRAKGRPHKDLGPRPFIPSVLLDSAWLREGAAGAGRESAGEVAAEPPGKSPFNRTVLELSGRFFWDCIYILEGDTVSLADFASLGAILDFEAHGVRWRVSDDVNREPRFPGACASPQQTVPSAPPTLFPFA